MRVVMTLCVKDEEDVLDAHLAFHLRIGVDLVIATDGGSTDGSLEILQRYADAGYVHLLHDHSRPFRQAVTVTKMARLAASEFGASWVLTSDADEFWYPRGLGLKQVLEVIPDRYGIFRCVRRPFVPRPEGPGAFQERMTIRLVTPQPINDPTSPYRPGFRLGHRGSVDVKGVAESHELVASSLVPLRGWSPIEVLHYPLRSRSQAARKYEGPVFDGGSARADVARRFAGGSAAYQQLVVSDEQAESGLPAGLLALDTRVRDLLSLVRAREDGGYILPREGQGAFDLTPPSIVDDALYAQEIASLGDADLVSAQRRIDSLESRLAALEAIPSFRLGRAVVRLRRAVSRGGRGSLRSSQG